MSIIIRMRRPPRKRDGRAVMVALTGVTSTLYSAAPPPNSGSRRAVFLSCREGSAARGRLLALRFSADDAATDDDADCCDAEGDAGR